MLATHALAGQPLNATTAVNYTRCVFQKVIGTTKRATCDNECGDWHRFKGGPTASRAEAFALCDADPDCDAVQEYDGPAETNHWAEPCGAATCYKKCRRLCNKGGRTVLNDRRRLEDSQCYFDNPSKEVYTCRPYVEKFGIRSPVAFSLFLIAAILGGPLVVFVGVKLSRRYNCKKDPLEVFVGPTQRKKDKKCGPLEWSLFYWFFSAFWLIIGFGLLAGYFGPQDESDLDDCEGDVLLHLGISFTSFAGFLLVLSLWLGQFWWRFHRKQDMKVSPKSDITPRRQSRAVSAFSAAAMKVSADTDLYKLQLAADLIMARRANDKNAAERVIDALGGGEHGILQAFMVLDKDTNGYVTATELRRVIPTNVPVAEVNAMLREADLEDDGRLNYEEFIRFVDPKGESWSRTMSVIKAIGKQAKVTPEAEPIMTGTVVEAEPAREPPPLHDIVDALKQNLGLDGNFQEVVNAGCLQLGVAPTGSLQEKADACWRAMEE